MFNTIPKNTKNSVTMSNFWNQKNHKPFRNKPQKNKNNQRNPNGKGNLFIFYQPNWKENWIFPKQTICNKPQKNQTILIIKKIPNGKGIYIEKKNILKKQLSYKKYK